MNEINKYLHKKIINIVITFILLQPVLDILAGISNKYFTSFFSIGLIIRGLFMLLIIYYICFISKYKYKNLSIWYLAIALIFMFIFIFININNIVSLSDELKWILKNFYFPILTVGFLNIFYEKKNELNNFVFFKVLLTYLLTIIVCQVLGINSNPYSQGKTGYIGIFNSANEISGIISLLVPFLFFYKLDEKNKTVSNIVFFFITLYCTLIIGTKAAFVSFLIISIIFVIKYFVNEIKKKRYKNMSIFGLGIAIIIILIIIILPKTSFGKNFELHTTFLKIENIGDVLKKDNINRLIFSDRLTFLDDTKAVYQNAPMAQKTFGIGYSNKENRKLIEIDYLDIYYRYGVIGFIIYFLPFATLLFIIIKNKTRSSLLYQSSIVLGQFLALFTGHIFTSPAVSIYLSLFLVLLYRNNKDKKEGAL